MSENNGITISKKQLIVIAAVVVVLLAGAIIVGLNFKNWFGDKDEGSSAAAAAQSAADTSSKTGGGIVLDPNAGEYTGEKPKDKGGVAEGIKIPGYPSITIAKDTQDVRMSLLNPEGNPCYFKFVIVLKDTDETIYESMYVEPGKSISDVHLTRALEAGEYTAVIKISTISLDGETPLNGANVETKLIVK
ncbi:MAG: hypothetical protein IKN17_01070 [Ruminococcus sp.]|nr:hypothetical protein [Ruminococcus sp.]